MVKLSTRNLFASGLLGLLVALPRSGAAAAEQELMIVGIDQKIEFKQLGGSKRLAPGRDLVVIVDIGTNPEEPAIIGKLPIMNSIFGPPTNLAISPDQGLAIVANSMGWAKKGEAWKPTADNKLHVIDLKTSPPTLIDTVIVGKRPSGLAINRAGNMALVANRGDNSISVLGIEGKKVTLLDTVDMGEHVAAVAFTPDGRRALAAKFPGHKIALMNIEGRKVTYKKQDLPAGWWPYNVQVTPNGTLALTADNGKGGRSDGNVDTVSVIDLEATPPRVIDRIVVGQTPEGLVISPTGEIAAAILLNGGCSTKKSAWYYNHNGRIAVLKINGKKVSKVGDVEVGGCPEGAVFSSDGKYLYVGNYADSDISILKVNGARVTDTGKRFKLPGRPASMRGINP